MSVVAGIAAGAAGTAALNITTYLDMLIRGRPSSDIPAQVAEKAAQKIGIDLAENPDKDEQAEQARKTSLGQLMGYASGVGFGGLYGAFQNGRRVSPAVAGIGLGAAVMAASDIPATVFGVTDPRKWGAEGWVSDVIPHLVYGLVTAATYEALSSRE